MTLLESNLRRLKSRIFLMRGRSPFARGYLAYRQEQLQDCIQQGLPEGALPAGWGRWLDERVVEYPWFLAHLPDQPGKLLDAGSVLNHDFVLSHDRLRNKSLSILTLAPESECYWRRGISYVYGDLRECCFRDEYFDWVACISTLEHVGMNNTLFYTHDASKNESHPESHLQALWELRRVLKTNGTLFLTLPYGAGQNLGWLQVFDGSMVQRLLRFFRPQRLREDYFRYSSSGWQYARPEDCHAACYMGPSDPRGGDIVAAEAVVCLQLVK